MKKMKHMKNISRKKNRIKIVRIFNQGTRRRGEKKKKYTKWNVEINNC